MLTGSARAQYLEALGIDEWRLRGGVPVDASVRVAAAAPAVPPVPVVTAAVATPAARVAPAAPAPAVATDAPFDQAAWEALRAEVSACTRCALHQTRTQTVFGVGNPRAQWMIVGEAPGEQEDLRGEPFVGRAGQLLNSMLRALGLAREDVYIANILKSRPPANRDPRPDEVAACMPFLQRQIELIRPRIMLAVGRIAAQNLLATETPLARLRGRVHSFGSQHTPLVITYHPAYLLRSPTEKRKAWEDLKFARTVLRRTLTGSIA